MFIEFPFLLCSLTSWSILYTTMLNPLHHTYGKLTSPSLAVLIIWEALAQIIRDQLRAVGLVYQHVLRPIEPASSFINVLLPVVIGSP